LQLQVHWDIDESRISLANNGRSAVLLLVGQSIITLVIIGFIVYIAALFLLRGVDSQEVKEMMGLKKIT